MPTGYTAMIDEHPEMSTRQWIMEGLARAFGVCIALREDSGDLSEEEIKHRIEKSGQHEIDWHTKELEKAEKQLDEINSRSKKDWVAAWEKSEKETEQRNQESKAEADRMKKRHTAARRDLEVILASPKAGESTKAIAKFGVDQLNLVEQECQPYHHEPETLEKFEVTTRTETLRNIRYHAEERAKAGGRAKDRLETYIQIGRELTEIFGTVIKIEEDNVRTKARVDTIEK